MEQWKDRLYKGYVSSGQAAEHNSKLDLKNYQYFQRIINKYLPKDKEIAIVDLACGHGTLIFCLKELEYQNVTGVDVSPEQVALAHSYGIEEVVCSDMHEFLDNHGNFDVVFLMDILEHLTREEFFTLLDRVYELMQKNGTLIAHVPNAEGIFGMRIRYGDMTHETSFTEQSVRQGLMAIGFENIVAEEDQPITSNLKGTIRNLLWRLLTIMPRLLLTAEIGAKNHILSQSMLIIARKP